LGQQYGEGDPAEAALGAAAGYGVERGLRALPLDKITPKGYGIEKLGAKIIPGLGVIAQGGQEIYKGIRGEYTPTEQYAQELGLNTPSSLMGDVAVRSLGIGNDILMGVPGYAMRGLRRLQGVEEAPANQAAPTAVPATGTSALDPAIFRLDASSGDALSESIRRGALGDNLFNALEGAREPVRLPADAASQIQPAPQRQGALQQPGQQVTPVQQPEQQDFAIQPNERTVRAATDTFGLQELQDENEAINRLADAYQQRTGQAIPQELSAMDKFQVLAKGLGIGLLVAAFPGFGVAAGLGLGLAASGDELGKRRGALAAGAQQGFENDQANLANVMEMAKARRQNLLDQISIRTGAEERAERARQFDRTALQGDRKIGIDERELGLEQQRINALREQAAHQGAQLLAGENGNAFFVFRDGRRVDTGMPAPQQQAGALGGYRPSYNLQGQVMEFMRQLDDVDGETPEQKYARALEVIRSGESQLGRLPDGAIAAPVSGGQPVPRLAPDGNYYIPDPNRPGKYIQVSQ